MSTFDPYGAATSGSSGPQQSQGAGLEDQQSVRVVYEDPAQREERERLMNMLKATTGGGKDNEVEVVESRTGSGAKAPGGSVSSRTTRGVAKASRV